MAHSKPERILNTINYRREALLKEYPDLSGKVQEIKNTVLTNFKEYVEGASSSLKRKGCHVVYAHDAKEAQEEILKIIAGNQKVAMSKNPVFTEIGLRNFLQENQVEVLSTDLGEKAAESPVDAHPWIASINTTLPSKEWVTESKQEIKEKVSHMEYGITGAEAVVEQNGTLVLLESEGNVRFTSNLPHKHIVVVGIDKIVPALEDALTICRTMSVYGLGRDLLSYISFINGPSRTADIEFRMVQGMHGPKEVYVVLLDNGRMAQAENKDWDALKCLQCGGCLVDCPEYLSSGLEKGYRFTGKRSPVLAKFMNVENSVETTLCEGCSRCIENCPVGIQV